MKKGFEYIEILEDSTGEVVKRLDITNESERSIERVISAMSINLNHDEYSIERKSYEDKQETI